MESEPHETTVTILGSGTCVPSLKRSSCSALIATGGEKLLFDSGPGTMRRLLRANIEIFDISHIFYSHFHPDHSGELVPFLFANKYPDGARRKIPLTITAGGGLARFYEGLKSVYGPWVELAPGLLRMDELDNRGPDRREYEAFTVESAPMAHNDESLAYRVAGRDGASVVYSGDTDFCDELIDLARGADLLICESSLPDDMKVRGHLTPSLAGKIASLAGVRKLVLTHFYPECDLVDIEKECRKTYDGPLTLAEDLMKISKL
ncbi:MAG: MBL fold metallo-hydrolase [Desulfobacterales bacterium]|nr:MBL fold metallo-hydrolase [Desulfobacterales bacterium]